MLNKATILISEALIGKMGLCLEAKKKANADKIEDTKARRHKK